MKLKKILPAFSIRSKILCSALLIVLVIVMVGSFTYLRTREIIIGAYERTTEITMNGISDYIDRVFEMVRGQSLNLSTTESLRDYASGFMKDPSEVRNFRRDYSNLLMQEMINNDAIRRIIVIPGHNEGFHADRLNLLDVVFSESVSQGYLESEEYLSLQSGTWVGAHPYLDSVFSIGDSSYAVSYIRSIIDFRSSVGVVCIDISKSYIVELLRESALPEGCSISFVTPDGVETSYCSNGAPVSFLSTEFAESVRSEERGHAYGSIDSEQYLMSYAKGGSSGVMLTALIPDSIITAQTEALRSIIITGCVFAAVIAIFLIWGIMGALGKTVSMTGQVLAKAAQGDLDVRMNLDRSDEFGTISTNINHIIDAVQSSSEKQRQAEIRFLEAQINPHFLYNTLDAISWTASEHNDAAVTEMLRELADILRYSISESDSIVSVRTEVGYLRKYLALQQKRFHYSFDCLLDIDPDAEDCSIHKLLLQPLIENAVVHAFNGRSIDNEITVVIAKKESALYMSVRDNGIGMPVELADAINRDTAAWPNSNIGLRNTVTRLKMYYGDRCRIHADTGPDGTWIEVTINEIESFDEEVIPE